MTMVDATDRDAEIDALDDDTLAAMVNMLITRVEAMPGFRRLAYLALLEHLEITPAPSDEPVAMVESALDRLAAAPAELEPLAAIVAVARHGRCQLLAAAMARRRGPKRSEPARWVAGGLKGKRHRQTALTDQGSSVARHHQVPSRPPGGDA